MDVSVKDINKYEKVIVDSKVRDGFTHKKLTLKFRVKYLNRNYFAFLCNCKRYYRFIGSVSKMKGNRFESCTCCSREHEDALIMNRTFTTPKGGFLTVKDVWQAKGKSRVYLHCSICSLDNELYPYKSITSLVGSLERGQTPCGCSSNPYWTTEQNIIRVNRRAKELDYTFKGFLWYKSR